MRIASARRSFHSAVRRCLSPSGSTRIGASRLGLPISAMSSFWIWMILRISSCARKMPSSISASVTSRAPASTITTASSEAATIKFRREVPSSWKVGLISSFPSASMPTRTAAIGIGNGMFEIPSANEAPVSASTSESCSWSVDSNIPMTCVSQFQPSGNSGRSGRSIMREVNTSFSLGRPSRRKNPPGIFPAA